MNSMNRFSEAFSLGLPIPWTNDGLVFFGEIYEGALEKEMKNYEQFKYVKVRSEGWLFMKHFLEIYYYYVLS
jgi:hypothetical protein